MPAGQRLNAELTVTCRRTTDTATAAATRFLKEKKINGHGIPLAEQIEKITSVAKRKVPIRGWDTYA
jgi:hypothetical protein